MKHSHRAFLIMAIGLTLFSALLDGQEPLQAEVQAVRQFILEKDYPELFGNRPYRTRIEAVVLADIDNDGRNEVVVQFYPNYRQSASIGIYQLGPNLEVTRVKEGLAPGALQILSGQYLDSHTLGMAVDFNLGEKQNDPASREKVLRLALSQLGGVVVYKNFIHADGRSGSGAFVDMTHVQGPVEAKCDSFEFARVRQIAIGRPKGQEKNYLAAWVGNEIYVYFGQIHVVGKDKCRLAADGRANECIDPRHWSKPSLWKPGAEKICGMMGLIPRFPNMAEYEKATLRGEDIKVIILKCELHTPNGFVAAEGTGARRIDQDRGDINKSLKMAVKSAHIDATLRVAGLSELFTQDLEDMLTDKASKADVPASEVNGHHSSRPPPPPQPQPAKTPPPPPPPREPATNGQNHATNGRGPGRGRRTTAG